MPLSGPAPGDHMTQLMPTPIAPRVPCAAGFQPRLPDRPEPTRCFPEPSSPAPELTRHCERRDQTATPSVPGPRASSPHTPDRGAPAQERDASDEELLAAYLDGDTEAFALLVDRHRRALFKAVVSVLHHHHDAEDALQDAFARAAHKAKQFRGEASLATWLRKIAIRAALSQLEARRRLAEPVEPNKEVLVIEPRGAAGGVEGLVVVEDAVRRLSYRLREPFVLRVQRGLTTEEVAELLGIPRGTVLSRVFRARAALAAMLEGADEPDLS